MPSDTDDEISADTKPPTMDSIDLSDDEVLRQVQAHDADGFSDAVTVIAAPRVINGSPCSEASPRTDAALGQRHIKVLIRPHDPLSLRAAMKARILDDAETRYCYWSCKILDRRPILMPMRWGDCPDKVRIARLMNMRTSEAVFRAPRSVDVPMFKETVLADIAWTQMVKTFIREGFLRPPRNPDYVSSLPPDIRHEVDRLNSEKGQAYNDALYDFSVTAAQLSNDLDVALTRLAKYRRRALSR